MKGKIQSTDFGGLTPPEQFLLHDESALNYAERLGELMADLTPANYLERRQVELITQADVDIDRQRRIIAECLHPSAAVNHSQQVVMDWRRARTKDTEEALTRGEDGQPAPPEGDPYATKAIAQAYAKQHSALELHYKALADAERRRRTSIEFLYSMQDRRARAKIPDAEVIE